MHNDNTTTSERVRDWSIAIGTTIAAAVAGFAMLAGRAPAQQSTGIWNSGAGFVWSNSFDECGYSITGLMQLISLQSTSNSITEEVGTYAGAGHNYTVMTRNWLDVLRTTPGYSFDCVGGSLTWFAWGVELSPTQLLPRTLLGNTVDCWLAVDPLVFALSTPQTQLQLRPPSWSSTWQVEQSTLHIPLMPNIVGLQFAVQGMHYWLSSSPDPWPGTTRTGRALLTQALRVTIQP